MVQIPDKQSEDQHCLLLRITFPVERCQPCIQWELPVFVIALCHLWIVVRKWDMIYDSVSCHHEITGDRATIAIIQFILMILMFPRFYSL